ncbi:chemotaxis protein CheB [Xinfangfangia sp. D13-10-4-6]|uniref:CheB methylesterase domain-containing protein n=1 Tax=Pseudogemmobacter hezensis TaxID=2737662 RepID=UPI0015561748|nr:CheB methylesterase domain-containing protein [Pseudogemmobacter hezensis]NPD16183.1 chemotaxis protein CheB [Pseudogemmobacter hezensis]
MNTSKVIIVTARAITAARLSRRISSLKNYDISGVASDLSTAYILSERAEPAVALNGKELARMPEFEGLLSLFRVSQTAWLEIPESLPGEVVMDLASAARRADGPDELQRWLQTAAKPKPVATPTELRRYPSMPRPTQTGGFAPEKLILMGASTGGIDALLTILSTFPADCPPCAIVQHTGAGFSDSLVRLFARCCAAKVQPAASGVKMLPGTVVVGAGCPGHLTLTPGKPVLCDLSFGPPVSGHTPSVDMLFRSAVSFAPAVTAVLLTGMGRDGAAGLLELRRAGAMTFAQDEASSTVYGMPRAAAELGAAVESLPLGKISEMLLAHSRKRSSVAEMRQT